VLIKMGKEKFANWFQDEVGMCLIVGGHRKKDHFDPELCIELMAIAPSILCMSGMTGHGKRRRIQLKGQIVSQWTLYPTEEKWPYGGSAVCVTGMRRKIRASRASPTACAVDVNHNPSSTCTAITTRLIVLPFDADHDR
jgi:hypothetical protein